MPFISESSQQTESVGESLGKKITQDESYPNILLLKGDMGVGKTTFLRGLARGLGIMEPISSPTFALMLEYEIPEYNSGQKYYSYIHADLYRADKNSALGTQEILEHLEDGQKVFAIEWSEKLPKDIFKTYQESILEIYFEKISEQKRIIRF